MLTRCLCALALASLLAGCTLTRSSGTASSFNDGADSWRHTDNDTEKTKDADAEAERTSGFDKAASGAAAAAVGWLTKPLDQTIPMASKGLSMAAGFVVAELLNAPPPHEATGPFPDHAPADQVHGLIFRFELPWDSAWMEDHEQASEDQKGRRDLSLRLRGLGFARTIRLTQDKNTAYGWVECAPFAWARGSELSFAVYDSDFMFDDGMLTAWLNDVNYYWRLVVEDTPNRYVVGKVGFLSESDVALFRRDYADLKVAP